MHCSDHGKIKGFIETSFIDWPGRLSAVIFLGGCNFRCPFCHNHPLVLNPDSLPTISFSRIRLALTPYKKWLGGICISGGEPTLSPGLPGMLSQLKRDDWEVKLDTNGSTPEILEQLIQDNLLDMVAMDIKAPLVQRKYNRCAGVDVDLEKITRSIEIIRNSSLAHQFRMTVMPFLHTQSDIRECSMLTGGTCLALQNFNPQTTLDPQLTNEKGFGVNAFENLRKLVA